MKAARTVASTLSGFPSVTSAQMPYACVRFESLI